jgi:hypothetical protein
MATGTATVFSKASTAEIDRVQAVERLVHGGASRLTAERIVEIERGHAEIGRARPHSMARR